MGKRESSDNRSPAVSLSFNIINPYAVKWAKEHAAVTLQDIAPNNRVAVRDLVCRAFTEGIPPRKLSVYIEPYIENMGAESEQQITEYRTQLLDRGYEKARLDKSMQKLIKRLRRERAELIARTEIARASNHGQLLAWKAAAAKGQLDAVHAGRIWIGTPGDDRMCETCAKMHHQVASFDEPFKTPNNTLWCPPLHDGCRCTMGLKFYDGS